MTYNFIIVAVLVVLAFVLIMYYALAKKRIDPAPPAPAPPAPAPPAPAPPAPAPPAPPAPVLPVLKEGSEVQFTIDADAPQDLGDFTKGTTYKSVLHNGKWTTTGLSKGQTIVSTSWPVLTVANDINAWGDRFRLDGAGNLIHDAVKIGTYVILA